LRFDASAVYGLRAERFNGYCYGAHDGCVAHLLSMDRAHQRAKSFS
jgi:hypothetical protein